MGFDANGKEIDDGDVVLSEQVTSMEGRSGGTPCFRNTRVPVVTLFDCLMAGDTIDYVAENYGRVTREQIVSVLEDVKRMYEQAAEELPHVQAFNTHRDAVIARRAREAAADKQAGEAGKALKVPA